MEARHSAQLSALQLSALQSRMEAVKAAEDAIRTERHDLRHRLQAVTELVSRGDKKSALEFLDAAQKRLDEHKEIRWCRPPVLDAVYEGELAIVVANALENAIHANLSLPRKQRKIRCKMVGTPGVMLELTNPCTANVTFDSNGLPVAQKEGHGLRYIPSLLFARKTEPSASLT